MKNFVLIFVGLISYNSAFAISIEECGTKHAEGTPERAKCIANAECEGPYDAWFDLKRTAARDAKEKAQEAAKEKVTAEKDKAAKKSEILEQIADADKLAQEAEVAYGKAKTELQNALDEFEKTTNEQGQALVKEIQDLISKLEENLTVKRDELNTEYQNSIMQGYEACKQSAEQLFMSRLGIIRDTNKKQNSGYVFSGGASLAKPSQVKKARAEAKKAHKTCVSETQRVLESKRAAALQKLVLEEKRLNQELASKQQELDRITNGEYKKKLNSLESELQNAQKELLSAQDKAAKDKQRLSQQLNEEMLAFDNDIALQSALANDTEGTSEEEQEARVDAKKECCDGNKVKAGLESKFAAVCRDPTKSNRSRRGSTEGGR